jgi:hypothetical protein
MKGKLWTFLDIEKRLDYISERINFVKDGNKYE